MAQGPYIIGPELGLINGLADARRQRGLALGAAKLQQGDNTGWQDIAQNAPQTYLNHLENEQRRQDKNNIAKGRMFDTTAEQKNTEYLIQQGYSPEEAVQIAYRHGIGKSGALPPSRKSMEENILEALDDDALSQVIQESNQNGAMNLTPDGSQDYATMMKQGLKAVVPALAKRFAESYGSETDNKQLSPYEQATQRYEAKQYADNLKAYKELKAGVPELEEVITTLKTLGKNATHTYAGRFRDAVRKEFDLKPTQSAIDAAKYNSIILNTVLNMVKTLFPGSVSDKETQLTIDTIGDPKKSPEEKNAALDAFLNKRKSELRIKERLLGTNQTAQTERSTPPETNSDVVDYKTYFGG